MRPLSWPIFLSFAFAGACIFISADEHAARFDQDGDGLDDILVGAYDDGEGGWGAGAAYLILTGG